MDESTKALIKRNVVFLISIIIGMAASILGVFMMMKVTDYAWVVMIVGIGIAMAGMVIADHNLEKELRKIRNNLQEELTDLKNKREQSVKEYIREKEGHELQLHTILDGEDYGDDVVKYTMVSERTGYVYDSWVENQDYKVKRLLRTKVDVLKSE